MSQSDGRDVFQELKLAQLKANRHYANAFMTRQHCPKLAEQELENLRTTLAQRDELLAQAGATVLQQYELMKQQRFEQLIPLQRERDDIQQRIDKLQPNKDNKEEIRELSKKCETIESQLALLAFVDSMQDLS